MIQVTVKLFAIFQEIYGQSEICLELPVGTTVGGVFDRLVAEHPELESWRSRTRWGLNLDFVCADRVVRSGDEVVLIPPVSGG